MNKTTTIETMSLPVELVQNLKDIASNQNVDYQDLLIGYLEEGVNKNLHKVKWCDFVSHTKDLLKKHNVPPEAIDEIAAKFTY
jgi:hypothetical protein